MKTKIAGHISLLAMFVCLTHCGGSGGDKATGADPAPPLSASALSSSSSSAVSSSTSSAALSSSSTTSSASASNSSEQIKESAALKGEYSNVSIYELSHCGEMVSTQSKVLTLIGDYNTANQNETISGLTGWNHATNGSTTEWKNLTRAGTEYNFTNMGKADASCNSVDTLNMILVKKYADWDHQHSNGFESHFTSAGITFGQVDNIIIDLKINSAKTKIPSLTTLKTTYSSYTSESAITNLDAGLVTLGFTFYDGTNLKASTLIDIDQNLLSDKWLRLNIKMSSLKFYSETNYVQTAKTYDDLKSAVINGMLVVGETKTGSVLRGNITSWSSSIPETFKEMDVSVKKIELNYH